MAKNISNETLKNVCKIGQGTNCCRYILCGQTERVTDIKLKIGF